MQISIMYSKQYTNQRGNRKIEEKKIRLNYNTHPDWNGFFSFVFLFFFLVVVTFVFTIFDVFLSESFQYYIFTTINDIVETFSRRGESEQNEDNEGE